MKVTNGLASFFIDENIRLREGQAVGTTEFLDSELRTMRKRLEEVEQNLRDFRMNNRGQLPDELEGNLRILDGLNTRLNHKEESLRSARTSLLALETDASAQAAEQDRKRSDDANNLYKLREKLAELNLKYTEQHPDIVRLKSMIEKLESEYPATAVKIEGRSRPPSPEGLDIGNIYIRQRIELAGAIRALEDDIAKINKSIQSYQQRVEQTSRYGQELMNLQRDYDNMRASYNSLLNRKLEAEISVNMEKKQKGEQFLVLDLARVPEKPVSPNLFKIFRITLMAGIGVGIGLIFLLEILDSSVRRIDRFEEEIGMPVLALVPRIFTARDRNRHRLKTAATSFSILFIVVLTAVFGLIVLQGLQSPLEIADLLGRSPKL
jgi:polysaccharide chain length determinant protein (PEP-CTERM system associated)